MEWSLSQILWPEVKTNIRQTDRATSSTTGKVESDHRDRQVIDQKVASELMIRVADAKTDETVGEPR